MESVIKEKRNDGGPYVQGDNMRSEMFKMDGGISMRIKKEGIQDVNLVSSEGKRLGSSKTKVIPTSQIRFLGEKL